MKSVIIEKPTVDECIIAALEELHAEKGEISTEIIKEPTKGFLGFGGNKTAKVKVTMTNGPEEKAREFIDKITAKMEIEIEYTVEYNGDILNLQINKVDENDKGILIGKRGNTLDEMQFLLSLSINKKREKYIKTIINVEDYRQKREETLVKLAKKTAEKCRYYRKKIRLEPMNPYERRIIHSTLQEEKDIITYSEGDEPFRKVVVDRKH